MKQVLFCLIFVPFFACTSGNKPMTEKEKEEIISEAKIAISNIFDYCRSADVEKYKSTLLNSPDFVALVGGHCSDYDQSIQGVEAYFAGLTSQKSEISNERFAVLDASTVLYTADSKWEVKMKNDSIVIQDPIAMQIILRKAENEWKILSWVEENR